MITTIILCGAFGFACGLTIRSLPLCFAVAVAGALAISHLLAGTGVP